MYCVCGWGVVPRLTAWSSGAPIFLYGALRGGDGPGLVEAWDRSLRARAGGGWVLRVGGWRVLIAVGALAAAAVLAAAGGGDDLPRSGKVVRVIDGDTIAIEADGRAYRCRLLGIDAPEMSYERTLRELDKIAKYVPGQGRQECGQARDVLAKWAKVAQARARGARDALAEILADETVTLSYDSADRPRDPWGRLLVYVSLDDADVSDVMLSLGLVVADTRFPCDRLTAYVQTERRAKEGGVGMWEAAPEGPSQGRSRSGEQEAGEGRGP